MYVDLGQRDSLIYTMGYDDSTATCAAPLPDAFYLGVRCGNPNRNRDSWPVQTQPCGFTVRYVMVPQFLMDADRIGPIPIAPGTYHSYSVLVGGFDVLRYTIEVAGRTTPPARPHPFSPPAARCPPPAARPSPTLQAGRADRAARLPMSHTLSRCGDKFVMSRALSRCGDEFVMSRALSRHRSCGKPCERCPR